ncbi:hypothetical protein ABPG74_005747 [Tetrahymena malaccensis]
MIYNLKYFFNHEKNPEQQRFTRTIQNDKAVMTYQELAKKYSISKSSVNRIINQIKSQNSSTEQSVNQSQISEQIQQEEDQETQNSEQEEIEETQTSDQSEENINESQEEIQSQFKENKKEKVQTQNPIQIPIQKPIQNPIPIQTVEIQNSSSDDSQEIQNFMVKIRKMIQYFNKEQSIFHIIGSTDFQQQQFITNLYKKNLEQIQLIHKTIQFELMFSRSNDFIQRTAQKQQLLLLKNYFQQLELMSLVF